MREKKFEDIEEFRAECHRLYQLDWMREHGYSPADLGIGLLKNLDGGPVDENRETDEFAAWEQDSGFNGEIWACLDEFLGAEYRDPSYMLVLLPAWMHAQWHRDVYGEDE